MTGSRPGPIGRGWRRGRPICNGCCSIGAESRTPADCPPTPHERIGQVTAAAAGGIVLATLAAGQFVMALDTTVMNTAIATVADDVRTTVTGIQTAITLYTLVMASLMITGGKLGEILKA